MVHALATLRESALNEERDHGLDTRVSVFHAECAGPVIYSFFTVELDLPLPKQCFFSFLRPRGEPIGKLLFAARGTARSARK